MRGVTCMKVKAAVCLCCPTAISVWRPPMAGERPEVAEKKPVAPATRYEQRQRRKQPARCLGDDTIAMPVRYHGPMPPDRGLACRRCSREGESQCARRHESYSS